MLLVNTGWFIGILVATAFVLLYPIGLALIARQRLKVSWRYFGYGALIFFLFQIISRVPLVLWLGNVLAPQLKASFILQLLWIIALALTAALFEEIGRYIGYRWLMKREEKTWSKAVMYGIGHGGIESMVIVGVPLLLGIVNIVILSVIGLQALPADQRNIVEQQFSAIDALPAWTSLLGAWERLWTLPLHIGLSVIVLQVFRRQSILWLYLAIALHAAVDFLAVFLSLVLGKDLSASLLIEGIVMLVGLGSIWVIWRLRDPSEAGESSDGTVEPGGMGSSPEETTVQQNGS
jgi:uncharacterized membrane protein YhfC